MTHNVLPVAEDIDLKYLILKSVVTGNCQPDSGSNVFSIFSMRDVVLKFLRLRPVAKSTGRK